MGSASQFRSEVIRIIQLNLPKSKLHFLGQRLGGSILDPMVSSFHWFLFCVCLECPGRFGGSWAERVFGVGLGVAGKADGA